MEQTLSPTPKKSWHEKLAFSYFVNLSRNHPPAQDDFSRLNPQEWRDIRKVRRWGLSISALLGASGVLLLYLPQIIYPDLFWILSIELFWVGKVSIPLAFLVYGILLAVAEIVALILLNLYVVDRIAYLCGFPAQEDPLYEWHLDTLFEVGMEKPDTGILAFGINPLEGLSKWQISIYTLLNLTKATLSNVLIKLLLARVLGRFVLRAYIDLVGIPVFAFWNTYTTRRVMREAQLRIFAPELIRKLTSQLQSRLAHNEGFRDTLYDALQFIAVTKRSFHHNHFLLANELIKNFHITVKKQNPLSREEILQKAKAQDWEARQGLIKLLIFGILIDGKLSRRENNLLLELKQENLIRVNYAQLKRWEQDFLRGQGLRNFYESNLIQ